LIGRSVGWLGLAALLAAAGGAEAQMLSVHALRDEGIALSAGVFVNEMGFLDVGGLSLRGEMPVARNVTPFVELAIARFRTELGGAGRQSETSWLAGAGAKVHLVGEERLGWPLAAGVYGRMQLGLLENIDLFSAEALVLGTLDLSDRVPLLVGLGAGVAYRRTAADTVEGGELTDEQTRAVAVLGIEAPLGPSLSLLAELRYERSTAGGLGVKYRL
jgi:hypothetical protein